VAASSMPSERIQIGSAFYLLASALAPRRPKTFLSHGDAFAVFDHAGDAPLASGEAYGLFHLGTRFLDRWELRLDGESHDNALVAAGFTRYGATDRAAQVLSGLFDTSGAVEDRRLPELFCGFPPAGQPPAAAVSRGVQTAGLGGRKCVVPAPGGPRTP